MADAGPLSESGAGDAACPVIDGAPIEHPALSPIAPGERIAVIDVLRGFALLGILPMNILTGFALLHASFFNPPVDGGFDAPNRAAWLATHLVFDMKMITIFSMLFGAGLVVMTRRAEVRGAPLAGRYYRRLAWLAIIGLLHAYLLWYGDILLAYALCGMLLFPVRRAPAWGLLLIAAVLLPVPMLTSHAAGLGFERIRTTDPQLWARTLAWFAPTADEAARETASRTGTYAQLLAWNTPHAASMQTQAFLTWTLWRVTGLMLVGMGLMRLGVFSGERSGRVYAALAVAGYALGLPLVWTGAARLEAEAFDPVYIFMYGWQYNYMGSIAVALGHVGLVVLAHRRGVLGALGRGLAAVGRTALSNYLLQTVACLAIFTGMGWFGRLDRVQLLGVTLGLWAVQVALSVAWLRAGFLYGPAEWAWRSLTYGAAQPLLRPRAATTGATPG